MTLHDLLERAKRTLAAAIAARQAAQDALLALRAAIDTDPAITEEQVREAIAARDARDADVDQARAEVERLEAEIARDAEVDRLAREVHPAAARPAYDQVARTGAEPRTYTSESARRDGVGFVRDVIASQFMADYGAAERLRRHMSEERVERAEYFSRDVGTSQFAGLTVPQYLVDLVAPAARAGRPLADNCRRLDLPPDGMTVNISRITTGTSAAAQAAEAGGVSETDIDDTLLTVNVRTIAGQQDVSFQAVARSVGAEQVVIEDLVGAYNTALDSAIINADGNSGTHLGIRSTASISTATLTDSSPTPAEQFGSLYEIQSTIETAVHKAPTHLVMHARRWHFLRSAIGTDQALVGQGQAYPPLSVGQTNDGVGYGPGIRGDLAGLPVIVDNNIPTTVSSTQDVILAVNASELFLWEDPAAPMFIRAEQPGAGNLMVKLVVYGYSAFTAGRYPAAHGVISGSGLAAPTAFGKAIS